MIPRRLTVYFFEPHHLDALTYDLIYVPNQKKMVSRNIQSLYSKSVTKNLKKNMMMTTSYEKGQEVIQKHV